MAHVDISRMCYQALAHIGYTCVGIMSKAHVARFNAHVSKKIFFPANLFLLTYKSNSCIISKSSEIDTTSKRNHM